MRPRLRKDSHDVNKHIERQNKLVQSSSLVLVKGGHGLFS